MSVTEAATPKTEKEWEARYDAETLARAEVIKKDPQRLAAAQEQAGKMAEAETEEARALRKVANKKSSGTHTGQRRNATQKHSKFNVFQKI